MTFDASLRVSETHSASLLPQRSCKNFQITTYCITFCDATPEYHGSLNNLCEMYMFSFRLLRTDRMKGIIISQKPFIGENGGRGTLCTSSKAMGHNCMRGIVSTWFVAFFRRKTIFFLFYKLCLLLHFRFKPHESYMYHICCQQNQHYRWNSEFYYSRR